MLGLLIDLYSLVVLGSVILSWIPIDPNHPVARTINALTEPVLRPIRKVLPTIGGLDFSPFLLLIGLRLLRRLLGA